MKNFEISNFFNEKEEGFFLRTGGFFFEENRFEGFFLRKMGLFFEYGRVFTLSPRGQGWHPNQFFDECLKHFSTFIGGFSFEAKWVFFLRPSGFFF